MGTDQENSWLQVLSVSIRVIRGEEFPSVANGRCLGCRATRIVGEQASCEEQPAYAGRSPGVILTKNALLGCVRTAIAECLSSGC